jgi:hypothetical protein
MLLVTSCREGFLRVLEWIRSDSYHRSEAFKSPRSLEKARPDSPPHPFALSAPRCIYNRSAYSRSVYERQREYPHQAATRLAEARKNIDRVFLEGSMRKNLRSATWTVVNPRERRSGGICEKTNLVRYTFG